MPDTKISAMPSATTPFAGTEVFAGLQSGSNISASFTNFWSQTFGFGKTHLSPDFWMSNGTDNLQITGAAGNFTMQYVTGGVTPQGKIIVTSGGFIMQDAANNNIALFTNGNPCIQINGQYGQSIAYPSDGTYHIDLSVGNLVDSSSGNLIDGSHRYYDINGNAILNAQQPAPTAPTGGSVIDVQSRATINQILTVLHTHGLTT